MKALIVVDLQKDFCAGGSLAVPDGDIIVPKINNLLEKFDLIIFTKDWHAPDMKAFASQHKDAKSFDKYINSDGNEDTLWPDHCVADTLGAEFHPDLDLSKCKRDFYIFKKGLEKSYHPYSGFDKTKLKEFLDEKEVTETYIVGLSLDYCVKDTAVDSTLAGYNTYVIMDCTMPINPDITKTLEILKEAGVTCSEGRFLEFIKNI